MDAVCFDMDGVLVDSEDYWVQREESELFEQLLPNQEIEIGEITGMNYREIYDYLESEYDPAISRDETIEWYDETAAEIYREQVSLLPGGTDLLQSLRDRSVAVAIVSSSPHHWIDRVRDRFTLPTDAVVSAEDIDGPGKPAPNIYEFAAETLGVSPDRAVAVEDSGHGIEAARRAGMHVVGFKHGRDDETDRSGADRLADDPERLREYLLSLVETA